MRDSIQEAIGTTVTDMMDAGLKVSFTKKELDKLGVEIPNSRVTATEIKNIRSLMQVSQSVFAKLLNVSISSIRQWEQGQRNPSGSTMILLELLQRNPNLLNYRLK
ncbi:type II toxin-antitoxin system MqsA family antitoxin [Sulfurovum sp. bin170]|uniref:helix-turn-helix domain-containing protein n=1 Tax=Sulfurovum sp. bin170 TaxID=2695268 RepID=UPI0013DE7A3A|nr:helix-turn-helix domain-containing protein [Sulfurovum sp. bin170]NEW60499.1 type II toxin-antitoxin system MqsA family antitoxin [Sulfurovum sp. bin170]